jgi:hypothetical protein
MTLLLRIGRVAPSCLLLSALATNAAAGQAAAPAEPPSIASRTAGLTRIDGFMPLYWEARRGRLLMEIAHFGRELLYAVSLSAGLGSNQVGLDRGQPGPAEIIVFERVGPKVLVVARNYRFRASSGNAAERQAVADSFALSVLWGFSVEAEEGDRVLVDATPFFLRDAHGVGARLRAARQGSFTVDESRSAVYLPRTKGFPKNTEVEVTLTFTSGEPAGREVQSIAPSAQAVTVREHHALVEAPDAGYVPRRFDPRVGVLPLTFYDYGTPITAPLEQRWIVRHRLQKKDPAAATSAPIAPIVYYVDSGAPEDVRRALVEGAAWWNEAFAAAGFIDAFQVRVLPPDADPMDVRYNVINWVHRTTRGWSYGSSVVDPRTGEIVKGVVTLDSQRVRQNVLIGSGLEAPWAAAGAASDAAGRCAAGAAPDVSYLAPADPAADVEALALARLRQLSAHEVGHTLGYEHNFAASSYGRASVMDYPAPLVEVHDGRLDLSHAYATGIGTYDKFATAYAYTQFPPGIDEAAALERLVTAGRDAGMLFIADEDARGTDAAHPAASLWDNGSDAVAALTRELEVRRIGLDQFGVSALPPGAPLSLLEARLLPLYLHHRYQLQAVLKAVGGAYFTYAVHDTPAPRPADLPRIVAGHEQRRALEAVLGALEPRVLVLPPRILDLIPPPAFGYRDGIPELFPRDTGPVFDLTAAATTAADLVVMGLLHPARAARLELFHARDASNPGFDEVVRALLHRTWGAEPGGRIDAGKNVGEGARAAVSRAVQTLVVTRLMDTAANPATTFGVRAIATSNLRRLAAQLAARTDAHGRETRDDIERFLNRPGPPRQRTPPPAVPAGEPI